MAYFVRQNPSQISEEYANRAFEQLLRADAGRALEPIAVARISHSFDQFSKIGALNKSYPSMQALRSSPDGSDMAQFSDVTIQRQNSPEETLNTYEKLYKMGLAYEQKIRSDRSYEVLENRLHASKTDEIIKNSYSQIKLPTVEIELYEFSYGKKSTPSTSAPPEVASIQFHAPGNLIQDLCDAGETEKVSTVKVHELDKDFWLMRGPGGPPVGKRKLVIYAHGITYDGIGDVSLPQKLAISFYSPHNSALVAIADPLQIHSFGPLSRHSRNVLGRHVVEVFSKTENKIKSKNLFKSSARKDGAALLKRHSGARERGKLADVIFQKVRPRNAVTRALNDPKELAAWASKDGMDVVLCRKGDAPFGKLSTFLGTLKENGLLGDYSEMEVFSCRQSNDENSTHGVGMNLPAGAKPEFKF